MAESPLPEGSYIEVRLADEAEPEGPLEAFLVKPVTPPADLPPEKADREHHDVLCFSTSRTAEGDDFWLWGVQSVASFHGLTVRYLMPVSRWGR